MGVFYRRLFLWFALLVSFAEVANAATQIRQVGGTWHWCQDLAMADDGVMSARFVDEIFVGKVDAAVSESYYLQSEGTQLVHARSTANGSIVKSYAVSGQLNYGGTCYDQVNNPTQLYSFSYSFNPSDFSDETGVSPYSEEQCDDFSGENESPQKTIELKTGVSCYKGCNVEKVGSSFSSPTWSIAGINLYEYQFSAGTCESIEPPETDGCFNYQDNNLNWSQLCSADPDILPEDLPPEFPTETPPEQCLIAYNVDGDPVGEVCSPESGGDVCFYENGQFSCIGDLYSSGFGCTSINGKIACSAVDNNGDVVEVDPNSVDHPANGGNGDGDISNDVFEPDSNGNVAGGGYGYNANGSYAQTTPSTSDAMMANSIVTGINDKIDSKFSVEDGDFNGSFQNDSTLDERTSQLGNEIISSLQGTEIAQISNAFSSALSGKSGSCPPFEFTIDFLGIGDIGTNIHCEFAVTYGIFLQAIMIFVYFGMSIRIILGA